MLRPLSCALGFLTRIPAGSVQLSERDVAQSTGFFAWVGALIAALLWAFSWLAAALEARTGALCLVALWALLTGGLHLDGLADTVDGLSGGRGDRDRTLSVMRDSRIGSHGALALFVVVALKWSALESLLRAGDVLWCLAPVVARFLCTLLVVAFPYARTQGLGSSFAAAGAGQLLVGGLVFIPVTWLWGANYVPAALVGLAAGLGLALRIRPLLGGLTGDVYGAAVELCETAMLAALSVPSLRPFG